MRFSLIKLSLCVTPIIDSMGDVSGHQIIIAQLMSFLKLNKIVHRCILKSIYFSKKIQVAIINLFKCFRFVFPFAILRF